MVNRVRVFPGMVALLLLSAVVAMAAPTPPVDPKSQAVLDKMARFLAATQAFTVKAYISREEVLPSEVKIQRSASSKVSMQRPDKLQVTTVGDLANRSFWYDGASVALYFPVRNQYIRATAPATLDDTIDWLITQLGLSMPLLDYLHSDPLPGLLEGVQLSHYLGMSEVMGVKCDHLAFKQSTVDWQVWVEDSATPVPRKVVVEYKLDPRAPEYTAMLSDWEFLDSLSADLFVFTPPEGASRIRVAVSEPEVE